MSPQTLLGKQSEKYVRVPKTLLDVLDRTNVDLFMKHVNKDPFVLYREAGYPLSHDRAKDLARDCDEHLFVRSRDMTEFSKNLSESLESIVLSGCLEEAREFEVLQFAVANEIEQSLRMVNADSYIAKAKNVGRKISTVVGRDTIVPIDLFNIVRHDFQTFVHVTNVAAYSVLLARELGICDENDLEKIAVGGLLHDLGKRHIPQTILQKREALTKRDWELIREHPQRGYEEMCTREDLHHGQLMMSYQHHEHVDGSGYPVGITGEEIHDWAKLLAVVDVFDALTGERPYRRPATKEEANDFLLSRSGSQFDEDAVKCWVHLMQDR